MKPEDLLDPAELPEDLQWIPAHYKLHPDDPVYLLLAWHWRRIANSEDAMKAAGLELKAVLDARMEALTRSADAVASLEETAANLQEMLVTEQARAQAAIQQPVAEATGQLKALRQALDGADRTFETANRRQLLGVFFAGLCLGTLASLALFLR